MPCFHCKLDAAKHEVDEVWFDFGEPNVRFCTSKDLFPAGGAPTVCDACKASNAHVLASTVLNHARMFGATGPLWPTRWWVRYTDGHTIGGDVGPRSEDA
jgi:hypothetical protein